MLNRRTTSRRLSVTLTIPVYIQVDRGAFQLVKHVGQRLIFILAT